MGQGSSKGPLSPLECLIKNFSDFRNRAAGYGATVNAFDLRKFCELEWPTFGVGWPGVGTLDVGTASAVRAVCYSTPGHPDQVPYIDIWIDIIWDRPGYLKACGCLPQKKKKGERPKILLSREANRRPKRATVRGPPVLPSAPESPPQLRRAPPPPYRAPPVSSEEEEGPDSTVLSPPHTRSWTEFGAPGEAQSAATGMFPLRETGERDVTGRPMRTYVPFTTSDLYNWKNQNPPFSEAPEEVITLLESVFYTHQPTWDDCQQLLRILFTTEERERIKAEGKKQVRNNRGEPNADEREIAAQFPSNRPDWDPNSREGEEALDRFRQILLRGLRAAARKPTNLSKVTEVRQGPSESPTAYLERLYQAYRTWTPIDPRAPENQAAVVIQFVSQSAPDIKKKLQKLDGFQGKSLSELVAIAQKVFDQREDPTKTTQELTQRMAKVLLAREEQANQGNKRGPNRQPGKKGRTALGKNQCAYCKEEGHWKREYSKRPREGEGHPTPVLVKETD
ncbi:gag protein [Galidia ERV]|nr:gag protein [Galidia ERV]